VFRSCFVGFCFVGVRLVFPPLVLLIFKSFFYVFRS
jgi:hypothetical protein